MWGGVNDHGELGIDQRLLYSWGHREPDQNFHEFDVQVSLPSGDARDQHESADSKKFTQSVATLVLPIKRFKNKRNESCCLLSEYLSTLPWVTTANSSVTSLVPHAPLK